MYPSFLNTFLVYAWMTKWICFVLRFTCLLNNWQNKSSRETKSGKRNPIIINHYTDSKKMARERGRELKCNPFVNLEGAAYRIHNMLAVSKHRYPIIYNTRCLFSLRDCKIKNQIDGDGNTKYNAGFLLGGKKAKSQNMLSVCLLIARWSIQKSCIYPFTLTCCLPFDIAVLLHKIVKPTLLKEKFFLSLLLRI